MPRPKPGLPIDGHVPEHPWYEGGLCTLPYDGTPLTDIFFSEEEDEIAMAKSICSACDIRAMCLETALAFKEPEGVWGGMTPSERRSLVRRRRRAAMVSA
jgi:WhiB family redox-sensing transcriptional regulator